jgi:hypothetical protein
MSDASMKVLQRLMKTQKMDGRVIASLAEELKMASLRGGQE